MRREGSSIPDSDCRTTQYRTLLFLEILLSCLPNIAAIGRPAAVLPQAIREEIKKDHAAEKLDGKLDGKLHGCQEAYFAAGKADMQLDAREDSLTECSSSVVQAPPPLLMPFEPLTLTFRHLSYYIPMPKVGRWALSYCPHLTLLK